MNSTQLMTTVQIPSRFAMPTCGHAFDATLWATDFGKSAGIGTSRVERDRVARITAIKGGRGVVPAYVPGTTVWSPPTS